MSWLLTTRLGLYAAAAAVLLGTGFWYGREFEQANQLRRDAVMQAAKDQRTAEVAAAEEARITAERARIAFDTSMEDAAHADPVRYPDALSAERVRRLRAR